MPTDSIACQVIDSPLGELVLGASSQGCCLVEFVDRGGLAHIKALTRRRNGAELVERPAPAIDALRDELTAYFRGDLRAFSVPLDLKGTPFERSVWRVLNRIAHGETTTYGAIARRLRRPTALRAVGRANGANPLAIVVPCHRVLRTDGGLCGYGGGIARKRFLLDLEGAAG